MKNPRKLIHAAAFLILCPVFISATYVSCGELKSLNNEVKGMASRVSSSPKNICDNAYRPTVARFSKALQKAAPIESPFANNKVQLEATPLSTKASDPELNGETLSVLVDRVCAKTNPGLLTQKILLQNDLDLHDHPIRAMKYVVNESLTLSQLRTQADLDDCIVGVSSPGVISTSSLDLPATNDASRAKQTQLSLMNYDHAYQYLSKTSTATVKIAFADTGVDCDHQDIVANLEVGCGYNVLSPGTEPYDNDGHGSHTAGTAAATSNNALGIIGTAGYNSKVYAIKVIDINSGSELSLTTGIQQAISVGVDVLNISIESQARLPSVESAVISAVNAGIVVVMAAGNHGSNLGVDVEVSPALIGAQINGAITVGSIDDVSASNNIIKISNFSNYGSNVEIAAVGSLDSSKLGQISGIYSLSRSGLYQRLAGTSQAAPVIAGAAALLIQFFRQHNVSYNPGTIEDIIKASTDSTNINISGGRVINFSKLVRNAYSYAGVPLCDQ